MDNPASDNESSQAPPPASTSSNVFDMEAPVQPAGFGFGSMSTGSVAADDDDGDISHPAYTIGPEDDAVLSAGDTASWATAREDFSSTSLGDWFADLTAMFDTASSAAGSPFPPASLQTEPDAMQPDVLPLTTPFDDSFWWLAGQDALGAAQGELGFMPMQADPPDGDAVAHHDDNDHDMDADSAMGDMSPGRDSTTTVHSSVMLTTEEFGRTYHSYRAGKYHMPNDEEEKSRLDMQHVLVTYAQSAKLQLAPLTRADRVLDLGTGTGQWAIEFAVQHPESSVLGVDLSPTQPFEVPPNCRFEIDDIEDPWTYHYQFDFIYGRGITLFLKNFPGLLRQAYDHLTPGGWAEFVTWTIGFKSVDSTIEGTAMQRWSTYMREGLQALGFDASENFTHKVHMEACGFQNVRERKWAVPANGWPRPGKNRILGELNRDNVRNGAPALTASVLTKGLGWHMHEVELLLMEFRKDLDNTDIHSYATMIICYGQKPSQ